jgi:hypothetical protein
MATHGRACRRTRKGVACSFTAVSRDTLEFYPLSTHTVRKFFFMSKLRYSCCYGSIFSKRIWETAKYLQFMYNEKLLSQYFSKCVPQDISFLRDSNRIS